MDTPRPDLYFGKRSIIPFRGPQPPLLKRDEPFETSPAIYREPHVRVLDLPGSNDDGIKELERILALCANGRGQHLLNEIQFDRESGNFRVLIAWIEDYQEDRESVTARKASL